MRINDAAFLDRFAEELELKRNSLVSRIIDSDEATVAEIIGELCSASVTDWLLFDWRQAGRHEELYPQVFAQGLGDDGFWKQYLSDVRSAGKTELAIRFLERLYKLHWDTLKPLARVTGVAKTLPVYKVKLDLFRGRVADVLYEYLTVAKDVDDAQFSRKLQSKIEKRIDMLAEIGR